MHVCECIFAASYLLLFGCEEIELSLCRIWKRIESGRKSIIKKNEKKKEVTTKHSRVQESTLQTKAIKT